MSILDRYAGLVLDLDGVLVRGGEAVSGAAGFVRRLRRGSRPYVFVTNNSTSRPEDWVGALARAKLEVDADRVLTSALAAANLLSDGPPVRCLVIGEEGLRSALDDAGVEMVDDPGDADAVVVGWDRELTYERLRRAAVALGRGARFVGTNPDRIYPTPEGPWPGNGATLAYLRAATGVAAEVAGKPQTALFELAREHLGVDGPVLVVGDQVETDVLAASRMGWDSALVLSGLASWTSLVGAKAPPTWVVRHVGDLDGPEPPTVRHAQEADLSAVLELLRACGFDTDGAPRRLGETLVAEGPAGEVVGTASWELLENAAHLRGVTVADHERGHGTGSHLVARALDELHRSGVEWVYLLTPGAEDLFARLGFWNVSRDRVPTEVLETAQFGAAASGATAMVRRLGQQGSG